MDQLLPLTLLHSASSKINDKIQQNQTRITVKSDRRKLVRTKQISTLFAKTFSFMFYSVLLQKFFVEREIVITYLFFKFQLPLYQHQH